MEAVTAERLIPYAKGKALDILFSRTSTFDYGINAAPGSEIVKCKWFTLSSDDACAVVEVITDSDLLDWILLKERRKSVRKEIAKNKHLHPVSRLFLLQSANILGDNELAVRALRGFVANVMIEMYLSDPMISFDIQDLAEKLIVMQDVNLTLRVGEKAGEILYHIITRENILFGLKVAEAAKIPISNLLKSSNLRYPLTNLELSTTNLHSILTSLGEEKGIPFVAGLIGDDIEKMFNVEPKIAAYSLNRLDNISADVARFCIDRGLLTTLRLGEAVLSDEALALIIEADAWREKPTMLLNHPDKNRVLEIIGTDLADALKESVGYGSGNAAGEWLASVANRFEPKELWEIVDHSGIIANARFVRALHSDTDKASLYRALPEKLFLLVEDLPKGIDLSDLLKRSYNLEIEIRQHVTLLILGAIKTCEVEKEIVDDAIDSMISLYNDDACLLYTSPSPRD